MLIGIVKVGLFAKNKVFMATTNRRRGFSTEKLKRVHRKEILFNTSELEAINHYCKKYRVRNKSKFLREAIISKVLNRFDQDYPRLF